MVSHEGDKPIDGCLAHLAAPGLDAGPIKDVIIHSEVDDADVFGDTVTGMFDPLLETIVVGNDYLEPVALQPSDDVLLSGAVEGP